MACSLHVEGQIQCCRFVGIHSKAQTMFAEPEVIPNPLFSVAEQNDKPKQKGGCVLTGVELFKWFASQPHESKKDSLEDVEALKAEKERLSAQADKTLQRRIWLVQGCLNLDHLQAILQVVSPCSRVILLASDPGAAWISSADSRKLQLITGDERLYLVTHGTPEEQAHGVNTLVDVDLFTEWKPILGKSIAPKGIKHLQDFYQIFTPLLNRKALNRSTRINSSHLFLSNALINAVFAQQINNVVDYKDLYKNKPVLMVATGPSLNKQLNTLQKYKDQFIVIAVDAAVPILKKHDIIPQYVVTIDPSKRPYWKHNELDPNTTFLIEIGCCPDVAWSNNQNYLVTSCHPDVRMLLHSLGINVPLMGNGGSVATSAFNFAHYTGANPIVMIGQDLAWTGGKDHAEGYVSQYSQEALNQRYEKGFDIEGYDGNPVRTEKQLLGFKTWFEGRISTMPETMVINATEGGAKINGAVQIPFESVCKEIFTSNLGEFPKNPAKQWQLDFDYLGNYINELQQLCQDIATLEKELNEGIKIIKEIKKTPKKSVIRRIEKINLSLTDGDRKVQTVIEMMGQAAVSVTEQKVLDENLKSLTFSEIFKKYMDIYESALPGVKNAQNYLGKIIDLIEIIILNRELRPEFLNLKNLNRWMPDGQINSNIIQK